jgi:hypothetical protein
MLIGACCFKTSLPKGDSSLSCVRIASGCFAQLQARELSRIARHLRHNPALRRHPVMDLYLEAILDRLVADNPPPTPGSNAKAIMVEWWNSGKNRVSLGEARGRVAEFWGVAVTTIKEAHLQYLRRWGEGRETGSRVLARIPRIT